MYATKRRRRNVKPHPKPVQKDPPKTNPSKRHRERLNSELELLASLLPFDQTIITKLDKLSILRLAVSYLRTKSYFQAALAERFPALMESHLHRRLHHRILHGHHLYSDLGFTDSESVLQALNGFLFVVTCDGEVFFASHTVEQYLGFHQSDVIHQSALELIHSEDREQFKMQLNWRQQPNNELADLSLEHLDRGEYSHLLQRCFRVRFRCLLDNASGFITLEISGKIRNLVGQNCKSGSEPTMALFALCCPFGPLPITDLPTRDYTFKSKHKMDMSPLAMDHKGRIVFEYSDEELMQMGGYDLVHPDDLNYHSAAHLELIKTGSSGLIAYRLMTKDLRWVWLQTSSRVIYRNSKPDFILCIHRHLSEDEGEDLMKKRGCEFKLPYPIIDGEPGELIGQENIGCNQPRPTDSKSPRSKKSKVVNVGLQSYQMSPAPQLREFLQMSAPSAPVGRRKKSGREPPLDSSLQIATGMYSHRSLNANLENHLSAVKPADFMYAYNGGTIDSNFYRTAAAYQSFYSSLQHMSAQQTTPEGINRYYGRYYGQYQFDLPYPVPPTLPTAQYPHSWNYSDILPAPKSNGNKQSSYYEQFLEAKSNEADDYYGQSLRARSAGFYSTYDNELLRYELEDKKRYLTCAGEEVVSPMPAFNPLLRSCVYEDQIVLAESERNCAFESTADQLSPTKQLTIDREAVEEFICRQDSADLERKHFNENNHYSSKIFTNEHQYENQLNIASKGDLSPQAKQEASTLFNTFNDNIMNGNKHCNSEINDIEESWPSEKQCEVQPVRQVIVLKDDRLEKSKKENEKISTGRGVATSVIQISGCGKRKNILESANELKAIRTDWSNNSGKMWATNFDHLLTKNFEANPIKQCITRNEPSKLACFSEGW